MNSIEALDYAIARLSHEASVRPERQRPDVLQQKLACIETLCALRDHLADAQVQRDRITAEWHDRGVAL